MDYQMAVSDWIDAENGLAGCRRDMLTEAVMAYYFAAEGGIKIKVWKPTLAREDHVEWGPYGSTEDAKTAADELLLSFGIDIG